MSDKTRADTFKNSVMNRDLHHAGMLDFDASPLPKAAPTWSTFSLSEPGSKTVRTKVMEQLYAALHNSSTEPCLEPGKEVERSKTALVAESNRFWARRIGGAARERGEGRLAIQRGSSGAVPFHTLRRGSTELVPFGGV